MARRSRKRGQRVAAGMGLVVISYFTMMMIGMALLAQS